MKEAVFPTVEELIELIKVYGDDTVKEEFIPEPPEPEPEPVVKRNFYKLILKRLKKKKRKKKKKKKLQQCMIY